MRPFVYGQSITELKSKAADGDTQAQLALAKAYHFGEGVPKDEAQAVQWLEKAAEHGDITAQVNLAGAYQGGVGVPKNYAAALRWYTKAAEQGNPAAQYNVGQYYNRRRKSVAFDSGTRLPNKVIPPKQSRLVAERLPNKVWQSLSTT